MNAIKPLLLSFLGLLFIAPAWAESAPSPYYVPPNQFNAELQIMAMGFSNIFGLFQNGTASFSYDEDSKTINRVRIAIDTSSLVSGNRSNMRDLANLLDTMDYPELTLTAPDSVTFNDGKAELKATVTFHGTSKPVTVQAVLNHVGKSPNGGGMWSSEGEAVGLSLHTILKRADFGMGDDPKSDQAPPFGDSFTLSIELQALKQ